MKKINALLLAAGSALVLAACGGGGSGSTSVGGTSGTGASLQAVQSVYEGPVTGFGSVIVNGVRYSSVGATVADDEGRSLQSSDLRLGMVVRIAGSTDDAAQTGTAASMEVVRGTQGQVSQVNTGSSSFVVLGQTVVTNVDTAWQGLTGLAALATGDAVEVYGAVQADGSLLATLVEKKTLTAVRVSGVVSALDATARTFKLGTLAVDYSGVATVKGTLRNGALVKVGAATAPATATASLVATAVRVSDALDGYGSSAGTVVKLKGVADGAPVGGLLKVGGIQVDVSKATLKGPATAITAGSFLEVKGTFSGSTLVATAVEFDGYHEQQTGGRNELYGAISQMVSTTSFVVNGVTVDASGVVSLPALATGTFVEIKGRVVGNVLKAASVKAKGTETPTGGYYELQGSVGAFTSVADFTVNGVRVDASKAVFEHGGASLLAVGRTVEVKGALNASGVFVATKAEVK